MVDAPVILDEVARLVEGLLDAVLPSGDEPPQRLHQAMRHAVLGGGKRIRPALVLAACRGCGGDEERARPAMLAVELLHAYTLVHDDLPAMDDDDLRRGRPTVHKVWDVATAILVGDALQSLAFEVLAPAGGEAVRRFAAAVGSRGVVGGQQEDLEAEGRPPADPAAAVVRIHSRKTAALIAVSCELGALAAAADAGSLARLGDFGRAIGLAFQIIDDLLDLDDDPARLGKTPGKDREVGKLTWVGVHGVAAARQRAARLASEAEEALRSLSGDRAALLALATFITRRER